jgi:two-component system NtrC family sensor kinase
MSSNPLGVIELASNWPGGAGRVERHQERRPREPGGLLRELAVIQGQFIQSGATQFPFARLLAMLLEHSGSECGFLGEVVRPGGAPPRLQALLATPSSWLEELRRSSSPSLEQEDVLGLVRRSFATGLPVCASAPVVALEGAHFPPPHQPLRSFLAVPILVGDELVGLVGLANRPADDDAGLLERLQPLLTACGQFLLGWRHSQRSRRLEGAWLRSQEAQTEGLRLALTGVEAGVWDWHLSTQVLRVSRRWLELLGYVEGELESTLSGWKRLCHADDLPGIERSLREHLEGRSSLAEFEYRARRKDGGWTWLLSRARVVAHGEGGQPARVVGTDVDITARKRSEERLSALVRAVPDLIFRMSGDGTYLDYNDGTPEPTVLPAEAFLGKNLRDLPLPPAFIEKALFHIQRAIREGTLDVFEYELDDVQGRCQQYEARIIRSGPDEAVCIVRNITERKQAEARQAQLLQSEKMASLGQMAAGIAHEINNPVSYVMSNLGTLRQYLEELQPVIQAQRQLQVAGAAGEPCLLAGELANLRALWERQGVEAVLQDMPELIRESVIGTQRIREIVQSLRTFTRQDSGEPQLVDLNAELESALRIVWAEIRYKCEVIREYGPLPAIACYPNQLAQVFTNLFVNAAQAIEARGVIRIRTWQGRDQVMVQISDTGKGMTPETLAKLSTPFFTTKPRGQGTGLGLSISYGIIARHKGRIEVESEPGKGSTFTIGLPLSAA